MEKKEEIKRTYRMSDPLMLVQGQGFLDMFKKHKSKFTDVFNDVKDPFAVEMQNNIDFCSSFSRDAVYRSDQAVVTCDVESEMVNGQAVYQKIYQYLLMVESTDAIIRANYGQPEYEKSRRSHVKLPVLLEQAYIFTNEAILKQKLIDKGAKEADILSLHTIGKLIFDEVQRQISSKGGRKTSKKDRILGLNKVWANMSLLSGCAKTVFMDNYAMYHVFLLYPKDKITDKGKDEGDTPVE